MEGLCKNILDSLLQKLNTEGLLKEVFMNFKLLTNDIHQETKFGENLLKKYDFLPNYDEFKLTKCNDKANEFLKLGNQLQKDEKFYEALVSYNKW